MLRCARSFAAFLIPLALAACGPKTAPERNLDSLDNELVDANGAAPANDPALMSALQQQIMVDPTLAQSSNGDAVRPPNQPFAAPAAPDNIAPAGPVATGRLIAAPPPSGDCPQCGAAKNSMTLGALAAQQSDRRTAGCVQGLTYSANWATRLPPDLPLFPDARLEEAAGTERGGCAMRAVSFSTAAPIAQVIDWYYTRATSAGYQAEHQAEGGNHVVGGNRPRDDAAFVAYLRARSDGGTDVDLVANNGV